MTKPTQSLKVLLNDNIDMHYNIDDGGTERVIDHVYPDFSCEEILIAISILQLTESRKQTGLLERILKQSEE